MSAIILNERNASVELSDADLAIVSGSTDGPIVDAILDAMCNAGIFDREKVTVRGNQYVRTCHK